VCSSDLEGNIFSQVDAAVEIIKTKYLISKIRYEGIYRKEDLEYPENALREAIINAVIHKDYIGTHTHIRVYSDKLNIWNEGILPLEIKIEDLKKKHSSRPRNELLAKTFYKAGLIESWGKGTIGIVDSFKKAGLPEPEYKEEQCGFSVYFYKDIYTEENLQKMGLNERQIKAILYIKEKGNITNTQYRDISGTSERTASRDLSEMVMKNIFEQVGKTGKGTGYILRRHKDANDATKAP
jgi:ATP-dependent DNA helicase RecG